MPFPGQNDRWRSWWQDEKKEVVHNTKEGEEVLLRKEDEHGRTAVWIELYWGSSCSAFPTFPNTALTSVLHEIILSQSLPVDLSHDPLSLKQEREEEFYFAPTKGKKSKSKSKSSCLTNVYLSQINYIGGEIPFWTPNFLILNLIGAKILYMPMACILYPHSSITNSLLQHWMKTTNAGPYIYFLADGNVVGFVSIFPKDTRRWKNLPHLFQHLCRNHQDHLISPEISPKRKSHHTQHQITLRIYIYYI